MPDISSSIRLNDQMSEPLRRISNNVDRLTDRLEKLGAVNKNTPDMSLAYSRMADQLSRLFNAAGGYKVMQLVGNAFKTSASAATEFESAMTGVFKKTEGRQEQLQGLSDAVSLSPRELPYGTSEKRGVIGMIETAVMPAVIAGNSADFAKAAERGNSADIPMDRRYSAPYRQEIVYPLNAQKYAIGDMNTGRLVSDRTEAVMSPAEGLTASAMGAVRSLTALTSAAAAAGKVTKALEQCASRIDSSPSADRSEMPVVKLQAFGDKTNKTASDLELIGKYAGFLSDTLRSNIAAGYNTGDAVGRDTKKIVERTEGRGSERGDQVYVKSDKYVREYREDLRSSISKLNYQTEDILEKYLQVKSYYIRDNGQMPSVSTPEYKWEDLYPISFDFTPVKMFIDGVMGSVSRHEKAVTEYSSFLKEAKEKQTIYSVPESDSVYIKALTDGNVKSSSPVINSVHDLKIFKASTESDITASSEHTKLWHGFYTDDITRWGQAAAEPDGISGKASDISEYAEKTAKDIFDKYRESVSRIERLEAPMRAAAYSIMTAYAQGIAAHSSLAIAAAQSAADKITAILSMPNISIGASAISSIMTTVTQSGVKQKLASGTRSAMPGLTLVGEEGPELVTFRGGESVYNALDTKRIMEKMQRTASTSVYIPGTIYNSLSMEHSIDGLDTFGYSSAAIPKENDELKLSDSDREYLIALGERSAVSSATSNDIKIEMVNNNNISSEADVDGIIDHLARGLQNALAVTAEGVHK